MKRCLASISGVRPGSLAQELGLRAGDCIVSINDEPVRDLVDYRFQTAEEYLRLVVLRSGQALELDLEKDADEDLGVEFPSITFDGVRRCHNRCLFCFVEQLPEGMRESLYVKDDDYRYSFLHGSFVTLSNLAESDWERIEQQKLGPLYVSVHATNLDIRRRLLRKRNAPDVVAQLRRLGAAGIRVHAQIVLVPEVNDGAILDETIGDLAELHQTVISAAIVPVGLTRHGPPAAIRTHSVAEMRATLKQVASWQRRLRLRFGRTLVHLGDEFYLRTGAKLPSTRRYDGFPQYQNGVGLARVLLDEWARSRRALEPAPPAAPKLSVITGELAAPLLAPIVSELVGRWGADVTLHVVRNGFFGETVNVAGLLTAGDVITQIGREPEKRVVVLPRAMFDADGLRTLDGFTLEQIERAIGTGVVVIGSIRELAHLATGDDIAA